MSAAPLTELLGLLADEEPEFRGGARVLRGARALDAMLAEIEATVLPAVLRFDNGAAQLSVFVSGRRLLQIAGIEGALLAPSGLLNSALNPADGAVLDRVAELFHSFAEGLSGELLVSHEDPKQGRSDAINRIPVSVLAEALGRGPEAQGAGSACEQLRARLGPIAQAWLLLEAGKAPSFGGDDAAVAGLQEAAKTQLGAFLTSRSQACRSHRDPSVTLWSGCLSATLGVGVVAAGDQCLVIAAEDSDFATVQRLFRQVFLM